MRLRKFANGWDTLLMAAIVLTAGICAQAQQTVDSAVGDEIESSAPTYWIGIRGRRVSSPVLRTQFQLAEDLGVVIEEVMPDSPAAKAGLREHDIILRAGGEPMLDMRVLQKMVRETGTKPIELQLIRLAKETTLTVVPEEQPADALKQMDNPNWPFNTLEGDPDQLREFMEGLRRRGGLPGDMQMFGPRAFFGGGQIDLSQMPGGVSITITREGDSPAKITVKQGDKTWEVTADDEKAIEQLPDNIRSFVKQMLKRSANGRNAQQPELHGGGWERPLRGLLPNPLGNMPPAQGDADDPMLQRLEQIERQLKELQQRLEEE